MSENRFGSRAALLVACIALSCAASCADEAAGSYHGDHGTRNLLNNGQECPDGTMCKSGQCVAGVCKGDVGDECALGNSACLSNLCGSNSTCQGLRRNGETCSENANCKSALCITNVCKGMLEDECALGNIACLSNYCDSDAKCALNPELLINGEICEVSSQCKSSQCIGGLCKGENGDECAKGDKACKSGYCADDQTCADKPVTCDPACQPNQVCVDGTCKVINGEDCNENVNCYSNICVDGVCKGNNGDECANGNKACLSSYCDTDSTTCADEPGACDPECTGTQVCIDHVCRDRNGESCVATENCISGTCDGNICKGDIGDECAKGNDACLSGYCNSDEVCDKDPNVCDPECTDGRVCVEGVCKGQNGLSCEANDNCYSNNCVASEDKKICKGKVEQECELEKADASISACNADLKCEVTSSEPVCRECLVDDDCDGSLVCSNYVCAQNCTKDEDCNSQYLICDVGNTNICIEKTCTTDDDCDKTAGKVCNTDSGKCLLKNGWDCTANGQCYSNDCSSDDDKCKGDIGDECVHGNDACNSNLCGDDVTCKKTNGEDCTTANVCYSGYCSDITNVCEDVPECTFTNDTCTKPSVCVVNNNKYECGKPAIVTDGPGSNNEAVTVQVQDPVSGALVSVTGYKTSEKDAVDENGKPKADADIQKEEICFHLNMAPEKDVTLNCEVSNPAEAACLGVTFTPDNYNETQCIKVWGLDEEFVDGDQVYTVSITSSSEDNNFNNLTTEDTFYFVNADDDKGEVRPTEPGTDTIVTQIEVVISNSMCNEKDAKPEIAEECKKRAIKADETEAFDVKLSGRPTCDSPVQVEVKLDDPTDNVILGSSDKMTAGDTITLTFTCDNWNTPQQVIVAGQASSDLNPDDKSQTITKSSSLTSPEDPISITVKTVPSEGSTYPQSEEKIEITVKEVHFAFNYLGATNCEYTEVELEAGTYKLQVWGASGGDASTINKKNEDESDADCKPVGLSKSCAHYDGGGDELIDCCTPVEGKPLEGCSGKMCYKDFGGLPIMYSQGGLGGYAEGVLTLTEPTRIYVSIGVEGQRVNDNARNHSTCGQGGRGFTAISGEVNWFGYNGGGATDIRIGENDAFHRVIVAGGGGGSDNSGISKERANGEYYINTEEKSSNNNGTGGVGGGTKGGDGLNANGSGNYTYKNGTRNVTINVLEGGSQTTGYIKDYNGNIDSFGAGMNVYCKDETTVEYGGGGGGWYGGKATSYIKLTNTVTHKCSDTRNPGGGGGSGFVFDSKSDDAVNSVKTNYGKDFGLKGLTQYQLTNAFTCDGAGNCSNNTKDGFPTIDGKNTEKGHKLDGYAVITRLD